MGILEKIAEIEKEIARTQKNKGNSTVRSIRPRCMLMLLPAFSEDYICRENSRQIAIIDYLFSVNFYGIIFLLLDIYRENWCTETYILKLKK